MKFSLIILMFLMNAACAPQKNVPQPTQDILPTVSTTDVPNIRLIDLGTSVPLCPCPSGVFPSGASLGGATGGTPVVCNCPAILFPPTISPTDVPPTSQAIQTNKVTLDDNRKTISMHPGESFLLDLGTDMFNWRVDIDDQSVLARLKNVTVIRGAQGIYEANNTGQAMMTAVGDPFCRDTLPACMSPSIIFKIAVVVQ